MLRYEDAALLLLQNRYACRTSKGGFEDLPQHANSDLSREVHWQPQSNGGAGVRSNGKHRSAHPEALPHLDEHKSNGHAVGTPANGSQAVAESML